MKSGRSRQKVLRADEDTVLAHAPLTEIDRAIITHLQEDGRRSFVAIAQDLDISEKTVRNRVHHLLDSKIIQITTLTSPAAMGYHACALVGLTTAPSVPTSQIARELIRIRDVDYVTTSAGRFNIMVEIISRDMASMQRVLEREIGQCHGITSTELFPYFSLYYQHARFFRKADSEDMTGAIRAQELDATDKRLVFELSDDGRVPLGIVADRLGISETQVRMRIAQMTARGQMNIMAIVNPMNLQNRAIAWLGINTAPATSSEALANELSAIPQISYIALCGGRYDLFAEIVCPSLEVLREVIDTRVRTRPGSRSVESFLYLDLHYKRLVPAEAGP